ncbi:MAG: ATP-binding protein [Candidatus Rokuibacteriota bacterium]
MIGIRAFLETNNLDRDDTIEELSIDNSKVEWIEPIGLVCLLAIVRHLRYGIEDHCPISFTYPGKLGYLQRMDLLRHLEVDFPERFRHHSSAGRFVTLQTVSDMRQVNSIANDMIQILPAEEDLRALAHYNITELLDNAFQHAGASLPPVTCAQKWMLSRQAQIAVADCGIGLAASLRQSPWLAPANDKEAVELALQPWTSGKEDADLGIYGELGNTGNGLSMIRKFAELLGGKLLIISGSAYHRLSADATGSCTVSAWPGTVVAVEFPLELPGSFSSVKSSALRALGRRRRR